MSQGRCIMALTASQSFVYRELTGRVIIVTVIVTAALRKKTVQVLQMRPTEIPLVHVLCARDDVTTHPIESLEVPVARWVDTMIQSGETSLFAEERAIWEKGQTGHHVTSCTDSSGSTVTRPQQRF